MTSAIKLKTAPLGQRKILKADDRYPLRVIKAAWKKRDETLLSHCAAACRNDSNFVIRPLPTLTASPSYTSHSGLYLSDFHWGSEFRLAMTDRATIAGMEVAKLVSGV